ncbi:checkpoint protein HUS1 [Cephus cinctus]|uniref:Checkpoint protein n=1 Tax=Cephus cinctus TaxID=211228 RepID=A0AAJ7BZW0_CEPCN|nr:checkpoint protein HUS1 [Cephus cinctus]
MKFKCRMSDGIAMRDFSNIVNTVVRASKLCVFRLTKQHVYFFVGDKRWPVIWAELTPDNFFDEYTMIGVSTQHDEIFLELEPSMLARSLSSLKMTAKPVKIKLTNKQQPCLTIELELSSLSTESRHCVHDVPVRVIPRKEWEMYQTPDIPQFDITIEMPELKHIRHQVDRMRNMSGQITIIADRTGQLILKIETDHATIATHFQGLLIKGSKPITDQKYSAKVEIKKFAMFLSGDTMHPDNVTCNIVHERMLNLCLMIEGHLTMQYFVPAMSS